MPEIINKKLAIIGCGKMGEAILSGLLANDLIAASDVYGTSRNPERIKYLGKKYKINATDCFDDLEDISICLLAVKPQVMRDVMRELASKNSFKPDIVISIAAGINIATINEYFSKADVFRVMPNTPLQVGAGMIAISPDERVMESSLKLAKKIFSGLGELVVIDESLQDSIVALSGSGPAYFALFVQELAKCGEDLGFTPDLANILVLQTMMGTSELLKKTGKSPKELIDEVSSPNGTTVAALEAMRQAGISQMVQAATNAAYTRSQELGKP